MKRMWTIGMLLLAAMVVAGCGRTLVATGQYEPSGSGSLTENREAPPEVKPFAGLSSMLDGWTVQYNAVNSDWQIESDLRAHGATILSDLRGGVPDIVVDDVTVRDKQGLVANYLKVKYRGRVTLLHRDYTNAYNTAVAKLIADMAQVRLAEMSQKYDELTAKPKVGSTKTGTKK